MHSRLSIVLLNSRRIRILFTLGEVLRRQHIHTLIVLGHLGIHSHLLFGRNLLDAELFTFLECLGFGHQRFLQLSWFRIEAVVVTPLLLKLAAFIPAEGERAGHGYDLELSDETAADRHLRAVKH